MEWELVASELPSESDLKIRLEGAVDVALADEQVRAHLGDRFVHIASLPAALTKGEPHRLGTPPIEVLFYSYTTDAIISTEVSGSEPVAVASYAEGWYPFHAEEEAELALGLARDALEDQVEGLVPHLLLLPPTAPGQRLIWITFTQEDDPHIERRALFVATVDLRERMVVNAAQAECGLHEPQ